MNFTAEPRRLSFTISEMLRLIFRIYLDKAALLLAISVGITLLFMAIGVFVSGIAGFNVLNTVGSVGSINTFPAGQSWVPLLIASFIVTPILAIVQFVLTYGPITFLTSEYLLGNRGLDLREVFIGASERLGSLAGGYFILIVITVITVIGVAILGTVCFPLFMLTVPLIYLFACIGFVIAPVLMLERIDFAAALSRAWILGKSRFWTAIGLFFLVGVVTFLIQLPQLILSWPTISAAFTSGAVSPGLAGGLGQSAFSLILSGLTSILILPLGPIASTLFYYDTRTRTEGLDAALDALGSPDARPHHLPSPMYGSGLNSQDFLNMLAMLGIAVIIGLAFAALSLTLVGWLQNTLPPGLFDRV